MFLVFFFFFFGDLVMVFDCVNHELLLLKLNYYGTQGEILDWFKSLENKGVNLYLQKQGIFVLVGNLLNSGFLWAQSWVLFFLTYTLMIFPCKLNHLLR